jgi:hypothetical protein
VCSVGNLREPPIIEVFNVTSGCKIEKLLHHSDMIDVMKVLPLKAVHKVKSNVYIQYLMSAGRDKRIVIWKLLDGKCLKRYA